GYRAWISDRIDESLATGKAVYYVPLMRTWQMDLLQIPGQGPNLTALLLRLQNGEALSTLSIGHYVEPHAAGFWQLRPPEHADDLIQADAWMLRELVSLVHAKNESGLTLVDCRGLPSEKVATVAVIADQLAARFEVPTCWSDQVAQKDLANLLAKLPNRCQIIEMQELCHAT
ncbi:MAG: hypothetical protein PHC86_00005, partial [Eubacteriales bacterium]|nr:hypothetical protein [Eubacteriales bacterium]